MSAAHRLHATATVLAAVVTTLLGAPGAARAASDVRLSGAGSTFVQPLMERWVVEFGKAHPGAKLDYQGNGSGGGIKAITDKTVAFAASDAPMNAKELAAAGGKDAIVEVPTCAGGVVPAYNLPGFSGELRLSGDVLAAIFTGKITKWNDAKIAALNPGAKLPDLAVTPAWRTNGSGTTFVFTNYLATQSADFKGSVGMGKQVAWPVGQGGKGNPGVAAVVQQTPGAIGYVEEAYATQNKLAFASVKNKSGKFVKATPASVSAAGQGAAAAMSGDVLTADIWDQAGDDAYPISAFTYLIVYKDLRNLKTAAEAQVLVDFLWWGVHDGQKIASSLEYAPLDPAVQKKVEAALANITFQGKKVRA